MSPSRPLIGWPRPPPRPTLPPRPAWETEETDSAICGWTDKSSANQCRDVQPHQASPQRMVETSHDGQHPPAKPQGPAGASHDGQPPPAKPKCPASTSLMPQDADHQAGNEQMTPDPGKNRDRKRRSPRIESGVKIFEIFEGKRNKEIIKKEFGLEKQRQEERTYQNPVTKARKPQQEEDKKTFIKKTPEEDKTKTEEKKPKKKKTSPPTSEEENLKKKKKKSDSLGSSLNLKTPMKPLRKATKLQSPVRLTRPVGKNSTVRNVKFTTLLDTWKLASSQNQAQTKPRLKEEMDSQTAD